MREFRVTFGQRWRREGHPTFPAAHPDGWLTIVAPDEDRAREVAFGWLGRHWSDLYRATDPDAMWHLYPLGELHRIEVQP